MTVPKLVSCLNLAGFKTETSLCKKDISTYRLSMPSIHGSGLLLTQDLSLRLQLQGSERHFGTVTKYWTRYDQNI